MIGFGQSWSSVKDLFWRRHQSGCSGSCMDFQRCGACKGGICSHAYRSTAAAATHITAWGAARDLTTIVFIDVIFCITTAAQSSFISWRTRALSTVTKGNRYNYHRFFYIFFQSNWHADINGWRQNLIWNFLYHFLAVQRHKTSLLVQTWPSWILFWEHCSESKFMRRNSEKAKFVKFCLIKVNNKLHQISFCSISSSSEILCVWMSKKQ